MNPRNPAGWTLTLISALAAATLGGLGIGSTIDSSSTSGDVPNVEACQESYTSVCIPLDHGDYDCANGGGNGPNFIEGPVEVDHDVDPEDDDPYRLDPDGDGIGCESSGSEVITGEDGFTIYFLDIGQGDASVIVTATGETLLVDGGPSRRRIRSRLSDLGIQDIDAALATHADADHIAGLVAVLEDYDVGTVYWNGANATTNTFENFKASWPEDGVKIVKRGAEIPLGSIDVDVLHPDELSGDRNEDSIVLLVHCGTVEVLLTGDVASEQSMIEVDVLTDVDVLKVGHHGSRTSTSTEFLDVVKPEYAVISAGLNNSYHHPHDEVIAALEELEVEVYSTDRTPEVDGVTMTTDCTDIHFDAE